MTQMLERPTTYSTVPTEQLPAIFQEQGLDLYATMATDLSDPFKMQIAQKSRQEHVMEHEGHEDVFDPKTGELGRFFNPDTFDIWAKKGRFMALMINKAIEVDEHGTPDIGGVIWFGQRQHDETPQDVTFAIRNYRADENRGWDNYQGRRLGKPFMEAAHTALVASELFPDRGLWLDLVEGNEPAERLYTSFGYQEVKRFEDPSHDGQRRILMVNDDVLRTQAAA